MYSDSAEEEGAVQLREEMRREKRRERKRKMRMSNLGTEQRAKMLARQENRHISEKNTLGLAKPTLSKESMLDAPLLNQESLQSGFAHDGAYNLYNKPLFHGSSAAATIYKARGGQSDEDSFGGGTKEGISEALDNNDFGLGVVKYGFEGAAEQEVREGPVYLEKAMTDVFDVGEFWNKVIS